MERPAPFNFGTFKSIIEKKETEATIVEKIQTEWPDVDYCICVTDEKGSIFVTGQNDFKHKRCVDMEEARNELRRITKGLQIKKPKRIIQ